MCKSLGTLLSNPGYLVTPLSLTLSVTSLSALALSPTLLHRPFLLPSEIFLIYLTCTACLISTHRFSMMFESGRVKAVPKASAWVSWSNSWRSVRYVLDHCAVRFFFSDSGFLTDALRTPSRTRWYLLESSLHSHKRDRSRPMFNSWHSVLFIEYYCWCFRQWKVHAGELRYDLIVFLFLCIN